MALVDLSCGCSAARFAQLDIHFDTEALLKRLSQSRRIGSAIALQRHLHRIALCGIAAQVADVFASQIRAVLNDRTDCVREDVDPAQLDHIVAAATEARNTLECDFAAAIEVETLHVIEAGARICGFVVFYGCNDYLHLENIAVDPRFQGLGLGRQLIDFVEQQASGSGYDSIELYTNAKMTGNLSMYPRLGYRETDRRREDGFDRVYFEKRL